MKERLPYIDRMRGINIFLVVFGHFIFFNVKDFNSVEIGVWGTTFRMAMFMFLCGYISHKTTSVKIFKNYNWYLMKKARTLLLPFFMWPLVVNTFFFSHSIDFKTQWVNLISYGGLWFLSYLFFMSLLYSGFLFLTTLYKQKSIVFDSMLVFFMFLLLLLVKQFNPPFNINYFIFNFLFYFLGVFVSKFKMLNKVILHDLTFFCAFVVFMSLVGHYINGDKSSINLTIKLVSAGTATIAFYNIVQRVNWNTFVDRTVRYWGRNSLVIYTTHFYLAPVYMTGYFLPANLKTFPIILISASFSILIILGCFGIFKIVQLSPLLNLLLYGHKVSEVPTKEALLQKAEGLQPANALREMAMNGVEIFDHEIAELEAKVAAFQQEEPLLER